MTQPVVSRARTSSPLEQRLRQWLANVPRGQFWLFFVGSILFVFSIAIFYFLFNLYLLDFGMTERTLGLIGGLSAIGTIAGTIPLGVAAQRFGLRVTLTGGVLLVVVISVLRTCIIWEPAQLVLAVLIGLTLCFWAVCQAPSIAGLSTEQQRPVAFSLIFAPGMGVTALASFVAGRLPGWLRTLFFLTPTRATGAALLLACAIASLALIPMSRIKLGPVASDVRLPRFSNPFLRRFLPAIAVWSLVTGSFAPFANVYFVHHLHFSMQRAGTIASSGNLAQFFAMLCFPLLFRRTGLPIGIMTTQLATACALASLAFSHSGAEVASLYCIYVTVQNMNEPGIYNLLMDATPTAEHNGASAATFFVSGIAQAVASLAMGAAIVRFGYASSMVVIAALAVVAAIVFSRLPKGLSTAPQGSI